MTDQTPVTDDDRKAREWADSHSLEVHGPWAPIIARAIHAHVPAPPATLADELRALDGAPWEMDFSDLADRVEAVEKHNEEVVGIVDDLTEQRDEARAEVERLTAEREQAQSELAEVTNARDSLREDYDHARAEVERLTAERDRRSQPGPNRNQSTGETFIVPCTERQDRNAETTNPADVPPGEAWIVEVEGERRTALKDDDGLAPWNTTDSNGRLLLGSNESVTPITRLVPAPRATLAAELRTASWGDIPALADRVEAVEKERDEARTKVEEVEGHLSKSWRQRDAKDVELERLSREREQQEKALVEHGRLLAEARAEVERLTASLNRQCTTVTPSVHNTDALTVSNDALPDPTDVPSEEMWLIRTKKDQLMAGVRNPNGDWSVLAHNGFARECELDDEDVTLVARLAPDTRRVIDRSEDLDALPVGSIVLDQHGEPWRQRQMDWEGRNYRRDSENLTEVEGPVTVIYTPEEES